MNQRVKRLFCPVFLAHAQAQLWCEAGGEDLARAIGDCVQQTGFPVVLDLVLRRGHQRGNAGHQFGVDGMQPARIELVMQGQHEKLGRIHGLGRAGQQLVTHALCQLAHHGGARRKAKVGKQSGDVYGGNQLLPPLAQALQRHGVGFKSGNHLAHALNGLLGGGLGRANPLKQVNQPQVALGQIGLGVQLGQQAGQIKCACLHAIAMVEQPKTRLHPKIGSASGLAAPTSFGQAFIWPGPKARAQMRCQCRTRFSGIGMASPDSLICKVKAAISHSKVSPS